MRWNLKNKFLIPTLSTIVLGLAISTALSYRSSSNAIEEMVNAQLKQVTDSLAKQTEQWVQDLKADISMNSESVTLTSLLVQ